LPGRTKFGDNGVFDVTDRAGDARDGDCPRNCGIEDNEPCLRGEDPALIGDGTVNEEKQYLCTVASFV